MSRANLPKCNFLNHDISTSILIILSSQKKQKNTLANKYFINYQIIIRKEYYKIQSDCQSLITSSSRRIIIIKLNEWNYNRSSSQRCIGRLKRHRISIPTFPKKELLLLRTQYNVKQRVNNSPCNQSYPNQTEHFSLHPFTLTTLRHPLRAIFPSGSSPTPESPTLIVEFLSACHRKTNERRLPPEVGPPGSILEINVGGCTRLTERSWNLSGARVNHSLLLPPFPVY